MSSQLRSRYDIVINGGGIVGFTLLNLILKSPHLNRARVLLIEQAEKPAQFNQPDSYGDPDGQRKVYANRVSSITHKSKLAFKNLGVWDSVSPFAKDVKKIKVWNYDFLHKITFTQDLWDCEKRDAESDKEVLFSTLENHRLSLALLDSIHKTCSNSNCAITWSSELVNMEESLDNGGLVDVTMSSINDGDSEGSQIISAPLILGCDGFKSKVRELTQMQYRERDLKKTAVVGTVKMSGQMMNSENEIAYQRFSAEKDTVAALLPLDKEHSSFVISAPNDYAKHLAECQDDLFLQEFNDLLSRSENPSNFVLKSAHEVANAAYDNVRSLLQLIGPRLGLASDGLDIGDAFDEPPNVERLIADSRASFPLIFGTTSPRMVASLPNSSRPRVALLGDAAHRVHPLAGQGLNLGIQDAIELVRQLEARAKTGERIFHDTATLVKALRAYELKRQAYVIPMSAGILSMQNLFKLAPSRLISSVDKCQPMKTASVRIANGV